jgi:DNA invertase Pin-like site-specific DNA recombinase
VTRCFAYIRVSGKGQIQGDGFTRQLEAIRQYAKIHDLKIERVFREQGVSGAVESSDRPAFAEMMLAVGSVNTIVIEKMDRLARDLMVQEVTVADLNKQGVNLISVMEPDLMASDSSRILMRQLMGAVAQYDKNQIVSKLRGARQRMKLKTGRCEGRKPFGYRKGEREVVSRMNELRAAGMGFDRIAATLNAEGIKTRTPGKKWHGNAVNQILKRQAVAMATAA